MYVVGILALVYATLGATRQSLASARSDLVAIGPAGPGEVLSATKLSNPDGTPQGDQFGDAVAFLGDLDGMGPSVAALAVGAENDDDGGPDHGAVWLLFLNANGSVTSQQKISDTVGGFTGTLGDGDLFGNALASIGDIDGDGIGDLAVGAQGDDDGGPDRGAVWVLFLRSDGQTDECPGGNPDCRKISSVFGGFTGTLDNGDEFGGSVAGLGDVDGDNVPDIAVGAIGDDDGGDNRGAVWILRMNADGSVKSHQKISNTVGGFSGTLVDGDRFGISLARIPDVNMDGIDDLAVGASRDDDGCPPPPNGDCNRGAVWIVPLAANEMVIARAERKISDTVGGFGGTLHDGDQFGTAVASTRDMNGDNTRDLVVGAFFDDDGGSNRGAVWMLCLNPTYNATDPVVIGQQKISATEGGFAGPLMNDDLFGTSVAALDDLNGDGFDDIAVGSLLDDAGGADSGAVWLLFLMGTPQPIPTVSAWGVLAMGLILTSAATIVFRQRACGGSKRRKSTAPWPE